MKNLLKILSLLTIAGFILTACEGPMGPQGPAGTNGTDGVDGEDGKDANETCKLCHNQSVVEAVAVEYHYSMHATGDAYEHAGTRADCAPCHSSQGFINVVENNTPATFSGPDASNKYKNSYTAESDVLGLPSPITCFTCHSSLHTNYDATEFSPLTSVAGVPMTMYAGSKTINFTQTDANLCSKCHQPRPVTGSDGNVIDYTKLTSEPTTDYSLSSIGYRTGVHYGTQAAMAAGMGGIEFGAADYTNSAHVAGASCSTCHMATPSGLAGGHSFSATANYNGCNATGCHSTMSSTNATLTAVKADIASLITQLADKINAIGAGHDILELDADGTYHGYFDIYDASANSDGWWKNPANGTPAFPTLTNAQFGAILNYQLVVRGAGGGVHNYPYIKKLLERSIAAW